MSYEKIVVVTRKTRLEGLFERFNTMSQTKFYLERAGADFAAYRQEHDRYHAVVDRVRRECRGLAPRVHVIERGFLPSYLFTPRDLVVAIGQDGLVVNTAKYLDGQPLVAINPDPGHLMGVLLPYRPEEAARAVARVMEGKEGVRAVTMAEVRLSDGQRLLAFNDLFIGPRSHTSARYAIQHRDRHEIHSSSGVIVATGAGSELRRPLGITIVGGLLVSQVLTLYTTPVVYLLLDRLHHRWSRKRPAVEGPQPIPMPAE